MCVIKAAQTQTRANLFPRIGYFKVLLGFLKPAGI